MQRTENKSIVLELRVDLLGRRQTRRFIKPCWRFCSPAPIAYHQCSYHRQLSELLLCIILIERLSEFFLLKNLGILRVKTVKRERKRLITTFFSITPNRPGTRDIPFLPMKHVCSRATCSGLFESYIVECLVPYVYFEIRLVTE